jgi:hypothetical protein
MGSGSGGVVTSSQYPTPGFEVQDVVVTTQTRLTFDVIQPLWRSRGPGRGLRAPAGAKPCSPD